MKYHIGGEGLRLTLLDRNAVLSQPQPITRKAGSGTGREDLATFCLPSLH